MDSDLTNGLQEAIELQEAMHKGDFKKVIELASRQPVPLIPELQAGYEKAHGLCGMPGIFTKFLHTVGTPPEFNAMYNQQYRVREEAAQKAYAEGRYRKYVSIHEKPYRIEAMCDVAGLMGHDDFFELFEGVWSGVENIWQFKDELTAILRVKIPNVDESLRFDEGMKLNFDDDGHVTVYRGYCANQGDPHGYSYSTCKRMAFWFANRLTDAPAVRVLKVRKEDISFTTNRRNENEVVTIKSLDEEVETINEWF